MGWTNVGKPIANGNWTDVIGMPAIGLGYRLDLGGYRVTFTKLGCTDAHLSTAV